MGGRGNVLRGVVRVCQWGLGLYGVGGCEGCVSVSGESGIC